MKYPLCLLATLALAANLHAHSAKAAEPAAAATSAQAPARFSVEMIGNGPDVILIPGLSSTRDVWRATAARLASTHRVHLIQLKGFGEAAGVNATGQVLAPFVAELEAYIRTNKLQDTAIIGHSMGGLAALMIGTHSPDLAGRIMVVDALPFIGVLFDPAGPAATIASVEPRAAQMKAMILAQAASQKLDFAAPAPACPAGPPPENPVGNLTNSAAGLCLVRHGMQQSDLHVVAQAMYDDMVTDLRGDLGKLQVPVTMLYPQDDRLMSAEAAASLYQTAYAGASKVTLLPVRGSYHFIMQDQSAAFNAALDKFLAKDAG